MENTTDIQGVAEFNVNALRTASIHRIFHFNTL